MSTSERVDELSRVNMAQMTAVARRYVHDPMTAEDLVMDAVIGVLKTIRNGSFRGDAAVSTYLYRAVVNTCITWRKRSAWFRFAVLGAEDSFGANDDAGEAGPFDSPEYLVELDDLAKRFSGLEPLAHRDLADAFAREDDYQAIADRLGVPVGTVRSGWYRVKRKLGMVEEVA